MITAVHLREAIASGDPERIHYALIDGSRCLHDDEVYDDAVHLLQHPDSRVRWAAAFAVDQRRATIAPRLQKDFSPVFTLAGLATQADDEFVRQIAATALVDIIGELISRSAALP